MLSLRFSSLDIHEGHPALLATQKAIIFSGRRRAFRDTLLPTDRSKMPSSIHTIIAAEAMIRYDEEHVKPPEGSSLAEESSHYGGNHVVSCDAICFS